jgi:hypothetical protein
MAVFSAAASILGARAQKKAAGKAAKAQGRAVDETLALQRETFETIREDTAPWREMGEAALGDISAGIADGSFDISKFDFEADPGYQFRLAEGMKGLDRSAAARGNLLSGAQAKAAMRYNQDFASTEYQNVFNRQALAKQTSFNQLSGLAGTSQTAVGQSANAGMNMANTSGNAIMAGGRANAQAAYAKGDASANMWGNLGELAKSTVGNIMTFGMM